MKKVLCLFFTLLLTQSLIACGETTPPEEITDVPESEGEAASSDPLTHPYVSITYVRSSPTSASGTDMVFYTYDMVTGDLTEACTIPFFSGYASGVVSKVDNTVYYSSRLAPEADDSLTAYDIATGESTVLESENWSYNEITMIDPDTLLVMAVTRQHPIVPALFDLTTKTFTYMPDVNGDDFGTYTNGAHPLNYNYTTETFISIYQSEEDRYDPDYLGMEVPVPTYLAPVGADLVRNEERIFPVGLFIYSDIENVVQLSETDYLVGRIDDNFDDGVLNMVRTRSFYLLHEEPDGEYTLTPTEPPFPADRLRNKNYRSVDFGKTWFLDLGEKEDAAGGLHLYDAETDTLTPILLNAPKDGGYIVNFSIIGPQKMMN